MKPYVSIVIPIYNEEKVIDIFHERLNSVLAGLNFTYEIIYIDDGSTDLTLDILKAQQEECNYVVIIQFRRNYGQTQALQAGFDHARGEIIISMDGDLQHDPKEIPVFIKKIEEGYDIVSGWREKRVDNFWLRRLPSLIANKIMTIVSGVELHDFGTTFKAYQADLLKDINLYSDFHRFIPALAIPLGASVYEQPISNVNRNHGKSKYGLSRTKRVLLDMLTIKFIISYLSRPIQLMGVPGIICFGCGWILISILSVLWFAIDLDMIANRGILLIAVMLVVFGGQLLALGLISEILSRIYFEGLGKKIYKIKKIHGR